MSNREETITHADAELRREIRDKRSVEERLTQLETIFTSPKRQVITKAVIETPIVAETDKAFIGLEKLLLQFFNGTMVEQMTGALSVDAGNIILTIGRKGGGDLSVKFSSDFYTIPDNSTIQLTEGTLSVPVANYIYILESAPTTIVKASSWPNNVEYVKIAAIVVQSDTEITSFGALKLQLWNDYKPG